MSRNKLTFFIAMIAVAMLSLASCEKKNTDEDNPTPPADQTGTFIFHLHSYFEDVEVDLYNTEFTTASGLTFSFALAQLYLSEIQLVRTDGSYYSFSGKKILKVLESDTYVIGSVPVGNYKGIRFKVGLDPATNALSPSASPDSAILKRPEMWFGSIAQPEGYVFMNVKGTIDTTQSKTGSQVPFEYKIGTNAYYMQVNMPERNFSIASKGQVEYGHMYADYHRLFNGIELSQSSNLSVSSPADNSSPLASIIANNISQMFTYEP